jgi:predicted PurR-regulated permease PerM
MADKQKKLEVVPPAEEPEEMPLPSDPKVIFLGGLFALALLAAVSVAADIVLPLVLAVVLKLLLQPAMRVLERWHVPQMLAALLLILVVFGTIVGLGAAIEGPSSTWAAKLSEGIPQLFVPCHSPDAVWGTKLSGAGSTIDWTASILPPASGPRRH